MRQTILCAVLLAFCVFTASAAEEVMTNADVVKLVKAGLTMNTIETKIFASTVSFDVGTDALIELSRDGVPDQVVRAMIVRQSEQRGGAAPRPATRPVDPQQRSRRFDVAIHRNNSKYAKCDGGELLVNNSGVKASGCRGSNFDIKWSDVQGVCFDYGYRGVVVFRGASKDYRISTTNPAEAREILNTISEVRPDLSLRETCE
jgi:hypothetical protein